MAKAKAAFITNENVETVYRTSKKGETPRVWHPKGWRQVILAGSITAAIALAINSGVLGWTRTHHDLNHGIATTFTGSCKTAKRIKLWSHLGINVLGTLLLAASNSCMQCLVAPTRKEVDRAHVKRRWLDIGPHTCRNLGSIGKARLLLWMLLALSSLPLHLVYNSVVFDAIDVNMFSTVTATPDFLNGTAYDPDTFDCDITTLLWDPDWILDIQRDAPTYTRFEPVECIQTYSQPQARYANVILVTKDNGQPSVVKHRWFVGGTDLDGTRWACEWLTFERRNGCITRDLVANVRAHGWKSPGLTDIRNSDPNGTSSDCDSQEAMFEIDYCLAQYTLEECVIFVATPLLAVVVACNFVKLACLVVTFFGLRFTPLITIGDAVESFLDEKDTTTAGFGVLTAATVSQWTRRRTRTPNKPWTVKKRRGLAAVSRCRWILSNLAFLLFLAAGAALLALALDTIRGVGLDASPSGIASLGLGRPVPDQRLDLPLSDSNSALYYNMLVSVIIANTPQLIVSVLYLLYNDLLTRIRLAVEWSSFHLTKQTLRVSNPEGEQRSTPFLELPLSWTIPTLTLMTCLHWMISQSIFYSVFKYHKWHGSSWDVIFDGGVAWSPFAIIISIVIGGVMLLGLWFVALFVKLPGEVPIVRSCSAAISAACHGPEWDMNASMNALSYGSVEDSSVNRTEHAAFCSGETRPLKQGVVYI